jgi:hypothetical protein
MNLHNVLVSLKAERAKLDSAIKAIEDLAAAPETKTTTSAPSEPSNAGRLSAAARARISKAQKARWAKLKAQKSAHGKK